MICYPFVFDTEIGRMMLYNGGRYGDAGFGIAVLERDYAMPHDHREFVEAIVLQQRHRPAVAAHAVGQHLARVSIIQIGPPPIRIARQAQHIEGEAEAARPRENIDGVMDIANPGLGRHVAFDVENAACDRKVRRLRRLAPTCHWKFAALP